MSSKTVVIEKATAKGKKWKAIVDGKTINFGAEGYQDFT